MTKHKYTKVVESIVPLGWAAISLLLFVLSIGAYFEATREASLYTISTTSLAVTVVITVMHFLDRKVYWKREQA